jgi:hypothetical protein
MTRADPSHRAWLAAALVLGLLVGCEKAAYYGPPAPEPPVVPQVEPLLLTLVLPPDGSDDVPEDAAVEARFSRAPDPATVTTDTFLLLDEAAEEPVDGQIEPVVETPGAPAVAYRFVPSEPLQVPHHPYRIEFCEDILAPDGAGLDCELSPVRVPVHFVTRGAIDTVPPHFFAYGHHATATGPHTIELTWYPAIDNLDGTPPAFLTYAIYAGEAATAVDLEHPFAVTSPGRLAYTVGGLTPNTDYFFIIHAIDEAGNEDDNTVTVSARTWLAAASTELTILYSADVFGTLEPCG